MASWKRIFCSQAMSIFLRERLHEQTVLRMSRSLIPIAQRSEPSRLPREVNKYYTNKPQSVCSLKVLIGLPMRGGTSGVGNQMLQRMGRGGEATKISLIWGKEMNHDGRKSPDGAGTV